MLNSARFRGDPVLERIRDGDAASFLRFGAQGENVRAVQQALIDRGFDIPDGATGGFFNQTSAAVVAYKTAHGLMPNDPVVGVGTITSLDDQWALPFADHDEFRSWQDRPLAGFNVSRNDERNRQLAGLDFTLNPLTSGVPVEIWNALHTGFVQLLDPRGSPAGAFTPSATWGIGPLDLYHCHVVVELANMATSWTTFKPRAEAIHQRMLTMMSVADQAGSEGTPAWTAAYRAQLLAPAVPGGPPSYLRQLNDLLVGLVQNAVTEHQSLKLVWHTFERPRWRPAAMTSDDPRRFWWNDVAPVPTGITAWPFGPHGFGGNVFELVELAFLADQSLMVTVSGETLTETAALVGLDKADIDAVI